MEPLYMHSFSSNLKISMKLQRPAIVASAIAVLLITPTGYALAQMSAESRIQELERKLERSMEQIDRLRARIEQLERTRTDSAEKQVQATFQENIPAENSGDHLLQAGQGAPVFHGFADVGLVRSGEDEANAMHRKGRNGFGVGGIDLFIASRSGDRVKGLVELLVGVEHDGAFEVDAERLQLGYMFDDRATLWAGRFHSPYGFWNTAFHHGAQIQTSVTRPRFLDFEDHGGILPAHAVGAWLTGSVPLSVGKLRYDLTLSNAPLLQVDTTTPSYAGTGLLDMQMAGALTHRSMSGFNVSLEPHAMEGLRLGLHGLNGEIADNSIHLNRVGLKMLGAYGTFTGSQWELLAEYYGFQNADLSGTSGDHNSSAAYVQAAFNTAPWTAFARYERASLDQTDNYFALQASGRSYQRGVVGLRYDVDPKAALKIEIGRIHKEIGLHLDDDFPEMHLQYSIRF